MWRASRGVRGDTIQHCLVIRAWLIAMNCVTVVVAPSVLEVRWRVGAIVVLIHYEDALLLYFFHALCADNCEILAHSAYLL